MFSFIKKKLGWGNNEAPADSPEAPPAATPLPATLPSNAPAPSKPVAASPQPPAAAQPAPASEASHAVAPASAPTSSDIAVVQPQARPERRSWMDRLRTGLRKTGSSIAQVFTGTRIDDDLYEELEAALLMADAGVAATQHLLDDLKRRVKDSKAATPEAVKGLLIDAITDLLAPLEKSLVVGQHTPTVIMVAGVNGAGKTTSIGKLTRYLSDHGQQVLLAAADTFRAAAREQLAVWADRTRVQIVSQEGGDPAAVTFDAVQAGRSRGCT